MSRTSRRWPAMAAETLRSRRAIRIGSILGIFVLGSLAAWIATERISDDYVAELEAIRRDGHPARASELDLLATGPDPAVAAYRRAFAGMVEWDDLDSSATGKPEEWLARNARTLELAREAAAHPAGRFPLEIRSALAIDRTHLAKLRTLGSLLGLEFEAALAGGRPGQAWGSIESLLGCARALDEEPLLVSRRVRAELVVAACERLRRLLEDGLPVDVDPAPLLDAIGTSLRVRCLARTVVVERCLLIEDLERLAGEGIDSPTGDRIPGPWLLFLRPAVRLQAVPLLRLLRELIEFADRPYGEIATRVRPVDARLRSIGRLRPTSHWPDEYDPVFRLEAAARNRLEMARAAILWHAGRWVANEDGLLSPPLPLFDHVTGAPMSIRREDGRIVLAPDRSIQSDSAEWPLPR